MYRALDTTSVAHGNDTPSPGGDHPPMTFTSSSHPTAARPSRSHASRRRALPRRLAVAFVAVTAALAAGPGSASAQTKDSTTGTEGDIATNAVYELRNVYSGLAAASPSYKTTSGSLAVQAIADGSMSQRWSLRPVQYDFRTLYTIRNQSTALCLAATVTKLSSGLQQATCALNVSQYWHLNFDGTSYVITNWQTRTRLAVPDATPGSALVLKDATKLPTPSTLERWKLTSFLVPK